MRSRWVLTAAHCLVGYFGTTDLSLGIRQNGTYETIVQVEIDDLQIHPMYHQAPTFYDIGEYRENTEIFK